MAKLVGLIGTGSGRIGNMVLAKRNGLTIARAYQPKVANPSTDTQVEQRAKFKLFSQLTSGLRTIIYGYAMGNLTARNNFMRKNIGKVTYANNAADLELADVSYTGSMRPTGGLQVTHTAQNGVEISGTLSPVYLGGTLVVAELSVATAPGAEVMRITRIPLATVTTYEPTDELISFDSPVTPSLTANTAPVVVWVEAPATEKARVRYNDIIGKSNTNEVEVSANISRLASEMIFSRSIFSTATA